MIRIISIDARRRAIAEEYVPDAFDGRGQLLALQEAVGGLLEIGYLFDNGDTLMVDEEGRIKGREHWFTLACAAEPAFAGDGVVVGPIDNEGNITDVRSTPAEIAALVGWSFLPRSG